MTATPTPDALVRAIRALGDVIIEAAEACGPQGIPSGHLYAAIMTTWPSIRLDTYESIVRALVGAGRIVKRGDLLIAATEVQS